MKLFPAKCHERATLRKLWRQTGNSSLLPGQQFTVDCCWKWWLESQRGFQILLLSFVLLYNKSLNDWSLGEQWILFPSNLNVSLDFVSGNIEILGKQNSLFPSGPVIKCLLFINRTMGTIVTHWNRLPSEVNRSTFDLVLTSCVIFSDFSKRRNSAMLRIIDKRDALPWQWIFRPTPAQFLRKAVPFFTKWMRILDGHHRNQ